MNNFQLSELENIVRNAKKGRNRALMLDDSGSVDYWQQVLDCAERILVEEYSADPKNWAK